MDTYTWQASFAALGLEGAAFGETSGWAPPRAREPWSWPTMRAAYATLTLCPDGGSGPWHALAEWYGRVRADQGRAAGCVCYVRLDSRRLRGHFSVSVDLRLRLDGGPQEPDGWMVGLKRNEDAAPAFVPLFYGNLAHSALEPFEEALAEAFDDDYPLRRRGGATRHRPAPVAPSFDDVRTVCAVQAMEDELVQRGPLPREVFELVLGTAMPAYVAPRSLAALLAVRERQDREWQDRRLERKPDDDRAVEARMPWIDPRRRDVSEDVTTAG